ncbi:MAG: anhydro-N-acetylmuramic acid kinase [Myxococcota bacterium]
MGLWVGLMSGTSADAVDAALVEIGRSPSELRLVGFRSDPLPDPLRQRIHRAATSRLALRELIRLDVEIGQRFADSTLSLLRDCGVEARTVEGVGSHGQTVAHHPEAEVGGTLQLGSAAQIHARTGLRVVSDFRNADIAAGGQGAPLTPYLHHVLFARDSEPRAVLNIGGFTNVSYLPDSNAARLVAFDPGPGNALLDRAVREWGEGGERIDRDGRLARAGHVDTRLLEELLSDPYFAKPPPKSTGHEHFGAGWLARARASQARLEDLLATLVALTVESVARAAERFFDPMPARWLLYGGGVHNRALWQSFERRLAPAIVETTDPHGVPGDALEAIAFALLGWASLRGLANNVPAATGARRPVVLGSATPPAGSL